MSADGSDFSISDAGEFSAPVGLVGVDELIASRGLEILRERIDGGAMRALLEIAEIVARHDAAAKDQA